MSRFIGSSPEFRAVGSDAAWVFLALRTIAKGGTRVSAVKAKPENILGFVPAFVPSKSRVTRALTKLKAADLISVSENGVVEIVVGCTECSAEWIESVQERRLRDQRERTRRCRDRKRDTVTKAAGSVTTGNGADVTGCDMGGDTEGGTQALSVRSQTIRTSPVTYGTRSRSGVRSGNAHRFECLIAAARDRSLSQRSTSRTVVVPRRSRS